ncbi:MAG: hypothetical protein M0R38_00450 [Bacteroidia bacterium]|nr:hypothetical protein [Bacteroidia bacterium]
MKYLYTFFFVTITLTSIQCKKIDVPDDTPKCIKKKIKAIQKATVTNPPSSVWLIDFKGSHYYYIPPVCCDKFGELYSDECVLICHPDGGITDKGDGQCPEYVKELPEGKKIWQDNRTQ